MAKGVAVDNRLAPAGLNVETLSEGETVVTTIHSNVRLETFIATLDDLLQNLQVAERTIQVLRKEQASPEGNASAGAR